MENTSGGDGGGIDVWLGSLPERKLVGVLCTVDLAKQDTEVKLLVDCTGQEVQEILATHNSGPQAAILVMRDARRR